MRVMVHVLVVMEGHRRIVAGEEGGRGEAVAGGGGRRRLVVRVQQSLPRRVGSSCTSPDLHFLAGADSLLSCA